jgi:hypothetical protein
VSLETPKRIFARQPRRSRWRGALRAAALLVMIIMGGGVLLAANLQADPSAQRQASALR